MISTLDREKECHIVHAYLLSNILTDLLNILSRLIIQYFLQLGNMKRFRNSNYNHHCLIELNHNYNIIETVLKRAKLEWQQINLCDAPQRHPIYVGISGFGGGLII